VFPRDIQKTLGLPLTENIYYRDLPGEIQKELWRRFFDAVKPLRLAGKVTIPRQSRGLCFVSRSKRLDGVANAAPHGKGHLWVAGSAP
jgi:hypothetical protein